MMSAKSTAEPKGRRAPAPVPKETPHVLIVGGGGAGGAIAHDLALRGLRVTLVERGEVVSGTTGRDHGLLHSGARYATTERATAIECVAENKILRRIAPGSFEENDGLFVALTDEDADFERQFLEGCWQCAVPTHRIDRGGGTAPGAGSQPGDAPGGPGARRDDGRDAAAVAILRHGKAQRCGDTALHRGDWRDDGRAVGAGSDRS